MMLTFFLLILLGLPCVDTAVNSSLGLDDSTIGLDNSTSGLNSVIQPRQEMVMRCYHCSVENTFNCPAETNCPHNFRRCGTIAMRMNSRQLLVYKYCMGNCTFMLVQPPPTFRRPTSSNSFYFSYCCSGIFAMMEDLLI